MDEDGAGQIVAANGRHARFYIAGPPADRFYLPVTYHRCVNGRTRQLTVSPKLMRRMLREGAQRH